MRPALPLTSGAARWVRGTFFYFSEQLQNEALEYITRVPPRSPLYSTSMKGSKGDILSHPTTWCLPLLPATIFTSTPSPRGRRVPRPRWYSSDQNKQPPWSSRSGKERGTHRSHRRASPPAVWPADAAQTVLLEQRKADSGDEDLLLLGLDPARLFLIFVLQVVFLKMRECVMSNKSLLFHLTWTLTTSTGVAFPVQREEGKRRDKQEMGSVGQWSSPCEPVGQLADPERRRLRGDYGGSQPGHSTEGSGNKALP